MLKRQITLLVGVASAATLALLLLLQLPTNAGFGSPFGGGGDSGGDSGGGMGGGMMGGAEEEEEPPVTVENAYMAVDVVVETGEFTIRTIDGDPDSPTDNRKTIFDGGSSNTTIRISDAGLGSLSETSGVTLPIDFILNESGDQNNVVWEMTTPPIIVNGNNIVTKWMVQIPTPGLADGDEEQDVDENINDLIIERHLRLLRDMVEIRHRVTNIDPRYHWVGVRLKADPNATGIEAESADDATAGVDMMTGIVDEVTITDDPEAAGDGNDEDVGPIFVPGNGSLLESEFIVTEREFKRADLPAVWVNVRSLEESDIQVLGIVTESGATPPDTLIIGDSANLDAGMWGDENNPLLPYRTDPYLDLENGDSAVAYYWNPSPIGTFQTVDYVTFLGVNSNSASDLRYPYQLTLNMPESLEVLIEDNPSTVEIESSHVSPNPFVVEASVYNFGPRNLNNANVFLHLSSGLFISQDQNSSLNMGSIAPNTEGKAQWSVTVREGTEGIENVTVTAGDHLVQSNVTIPGTTTQTLTSTKEPPLFFMLSFPFNLPDTDPLAVLQSLGLDYEELRLARYNPLNGAYSYFPNDLLARDIEQGGGYWLRLDTPSTVSLQNAQVVDSAQSFSLSLHPGWNQLGNPYSSPILVGGLRFTRGFLEYSYQEAINNRTIRPNVFVWNGDVQDYDGPLYRTSDQIPAWAGFWIYSEAESSLVFSSPRFLGPFPSRSLSHQASQNRVIETTEDPSEWKLRFKATVGDREDRINVIGVHSRALTGRDSIDVEEPPRPSPSVALYFDQPQSDIGRSLPALSQDFRQKTGSRQVWNMVVSNELGGEVDITWDADLSRLPNDVKPILVDLVSGQRIYMRTNSHYRYQTGNGKNIRRFQVVVDPQMDSPLRIFGLRGVATRNQGMTFGFNLSHDANISCTLRTLTGRVVKHLTASHFMGRGQNSIYWDGRGKGNQPVPPGIYLIVVEPTTSERRTARAESLFRWK